MLKISDSLQSIPPITFKTYWGSLSPLRQSIVIIGALFFSTLSLAYSLSRVFPGMRSIIRARQEKPNEISTHGVTKSARTLESQQTGKDDAEPIQPTEKEISKADTIFLQLLERNKSKLQNLLIDAVKECNIPLQKTQETIKNEITNSMAKTLSAVKPAPSETELTKIPSTNEAEHTQEELSQPSADQQKFFNNRADDIIQSLTYLVLFRKSLNLKQNDFHEILKEKIESDTLSFTELTYLNTLATFFIRYESKDSFEHFYKYLSDDQINEIINYSALLKTQLDKEKKSFESLITKFHKLIEDKINITDEKIEFLIKKLNEKIANKTILSDDEVIYLNQWKEFLISFDKQISVSVCPFDFICKIDIIEFYSIYNPMKEIIAQIEKAEFVELMKLEEIREDLNEIKELIYRVDFDTTNFYSYHEGFSNNPAVDANNQKHVLFIKACNKFYNKYETNKYNPLEIEKWKVKFVEEGFDNVIKSILLCYKHKIAFQDLL
ncbi:MAG: hypothetical protein H0W88_03345 [Parachlamydiaceae bacterium]|nr:hypothetical protein [Parachlamydiaceae bacterium]